MSDLNAAYARCQRLARQSASNFYFSFWLLPRAKRAAMCALYAFMRHADDLADSDDSLDQRRRGLNAFRRQLSAALAGVDDHPTLPAMVDTVVRHRIPSEYLFAVLDGVEMDLDARRYQSFADLEDYCYHVAGVVGLACIHIWGCRDQAAFEPAVQCGLAFQLTNILRDVREDAARGRVYLPADELAQFGCDPAGWCDGRHDPGFRDLMRFQIARAERYYHAADALHAHLDLDGRRILSTMSATYRGLLERLKQLDGELPHGRVRLSRWAKMRIAARSLFCRPPLASDGAVAKAEPP